MEYSVILVGLGAIAIGYDEDQPDAIWTHVKAIKNNPNFKLVAGIDPNLDKRERFTAITQCKNYRSLEECSVQADVVIIANPTDQHLNTLKKVKALDFKYVVMEKPLAVDLDELEDILTLDMKIVVNLFRLYLPLLNRSLAELADGGDVRIRVTYSKGLIHNGIHFMSLLIRHFGEVISVDISEHLDYVFRFKNAALYMTPSNPNLDNNSMIVESNKGILYYLNGGRDVFFMDSNNQKTSLDYNEFLQYQKYLYEELLCFIEGGQDESFRLALESQKILIQAESICD